MDYFLRFTAGWLFYAGIPVFLIVILLRMKWYRPVTWRYPMGMLFAAQGFSARSMGTYVLGFLHILLLSLLLFFMGKPQLVDERSLLPVQGIDIVLVLDASGSMQFIDDADDERTRFQVAKDEAIRFVQKRENDAVGLVIFGNDAVTRSPITHDKQTLQRTIEDLSLGFIDPEGTVLATGMMTALNRLKYSTAKSKIMIVLTDGEPSPNDQDPKIPLDVAKQLGIKIYTIGIGAEEARRVMHPLYGIVIIPTVNKELLSRIAQETGGQFFQAKNPKDMRAIYDSIDALERDEHEVPVFTRYYELFALYGYWTLIIVWLIVLASTFVWFRI